MWNSYCCFYKTIFITYYYCMENKSKPQGPNNKKPKMIRFNLYWMYSLIAFVNLLKIDLWNFLRMLLQRTPGNIAFTWRLRIILAGRAFFCGMRISVPEGRKRWSGTGRAARMRSSFMNFCSMNFRSSGRS